MDMEENTIKFIRLQTGEDLISQVVEIEREGGNSIILINPMKLIYMTGSKKGVLSISMMQWVFNRICDYQEFTIYPEDIITMSRPSAAITQYYSEIVEHFETVNIETEYEPNKNMLKDELDDSGPPDDMDRMQEIIDTLKIDKKRLH